MTGCGCLRTLSPLTAAHTGAPHRASFLDTTINAAALVDKLEAVGAGRPSSSTTDVDVLERLIGFWGPKIGDEVRNARRPCSK